jgi:hypothetical protein
MNRKKTLQAVSLIISSLALLYLLFINVYRDTFVLHDWTVVTIDVFVKVIIEIALLKEEN